VVIFVTFISWMAPEALKEGRFTTASDVWSFGVVLWEIWSYAVLPYAAMTNQEVFEATTTSQNKRLEQPAGCPDAIYRLMKDVRPLMSSSNASRFGSAGS
jgi:megakaryocyte-associated tyrosine kinase